MQQRNAGFTLMEIIVALLVFAVLGIMVGLAIHRVIRTDQHIKIADRALQNFQVAMTVMQRDFSQMIQRPVSDRMGAELPALISPGAGSIEFTRAGFMNPLQYYQRTELQRVSYTLKDGFLIRTTWPALDRPMQPKPEHRVLLKGVMNMSIQFIDNNGQLQNAWVAGAVAGENMPAAVVVTLQFGPAGSVKRIFPVAGVGLNDQNS